MMAKDLRRNNRGQLADFAAAMAGLVVLMIPLFGLATIPLRYFVCQAMVSSISNKLGHTENRSQAYQLLRDDKQWAENLKQFAVDVKDTELTFLVLPYKNKEIIITEKQKFPQQLLPERKDTNIAYALSLKTQCALRPLWPDSQLPLPGLSTPLACRFEIITPWENLSIDPATGKYFIEE